jgi:dTDP-4-dehydrorhamnose 3,5-epimerase
MTFHAEAVARAEAFACAGLPSTFVQDNHSRSRRGVLRGLHDQEPDPQGKLVRCTRGALFDVAVDIRRSPPTFAKWYGVELSESNRLMPWIPPGFAHGFCTLTDEADLVYKCTSLYRPRVRPRHHLERSRHRHRMAAARPDSLAERHRRAATPRRPLDTHPTRPYDARPRWNAA